MNIPTIRFQGSSNHLRTGNPSSPSRTPNRKIQFDFSDSSSSDEPNLILNKSSTKKEIPKRNSESSSSDYSSDSSSDEEIKNKSNTINWASKTPEKQRQQIRPPPRMFTPQRPIRANPHNANPQKKPISTPKRPFRLIDVNLSSDDSDSFSDDIPTLSRKIESSSDSESSSENKTQNEIKPAYNKPPEPHESTTPENSNEQTNSNDFVKVESNVSTPIEEPVTNPPPNTNQDLSTQEFKSYDIIYDKKRFKKSRRILLADSNSTILYGKKLHDNLSKFYMVCTDKSSNYKESGYVGLVRKFSKKSFVFITKDEIENDDREPEICGVHLVKDKEIVVVYSANLKPYYPRCERLSLCKKFEEDKDDPNLKIIKSKDLDIRDETMPIPIGNVSIIPSAKNKIFVDENNNILMMIYKAAMGLFRIKYKEPLNMEIAYTIAVSVITSIK
ncbi:hypothetical protein GPJ56_000951 [Histomonas meleagridis]|uniref:uncharacterized protein n=1 Tax=Histomonas meleagridis TaxID=135588 RepID=UPI0035594889|nr:hypothetical protein GPJ56_000951 [Histomonas meleagridis]KAH0803786.1 hypothetical protein GO595_002616 [Histomonas meleagridis]